MTRRGLTSWCWAFRRLITTIKTIRREVAFPFHWYTFQSILASKHVIYESNHILSWFYVYYRCKIWIKNLYMHLPAQLNFSGSSWLELSPVGLFMILNINRRGMITYKVCAKLYLNRICISGCLRRPIPFICRSHAGLYSAILSQLAMKLTSTFGKRGQGKHSFGPTVIEKIRHWCPKKEDVIAYVISGICFIFSR